jgi:hypothetical protein
MEQQREFSERYGFGTMGGKSLVWGRRGLGKVERLMKDLLI